MDDYIGHWSIHGRRRYVEVPSRSGSKRNRPSPPASSRSGRPPCERRLPGALGLAVPVKASPVGWLPLEGSRIWLDAADHRAHHSMSRPLSAGAPIISSALNPARLWRHWSQRWYRVLPDQNLPHWARGHESSFKKTSYRPTCWKLKALAFIPFSL